jgi:hypothetical protein
MRIYSTLRNSLDVVKAELESSARAHLDIANEIRLQLEKPSNDFLTTQSTVRKNVRWKKNKTGVPFETFSRVISTYTS